MYWRGPVCLHRKVWPVGKVRGRESSDWVRPRETHLGGVAGLGFLEKGLAILVVESGGVGGGVGLARFMIGKELDLNECMQMVATNSRFFSPLQLPPACERRGTERIVDAARAWIIAHQGWA